VIVEPFDLLRIERSDDFLFCVELRDNERDEIFAVQELDVIALALTDVLEIAVCFAVLKCSLSECGAARQIVPADGIRRRRDVFGNLLPHLRKRLQAFNAKRVGRSEGTLSGISLEFASASALLL
jgi:hypothetical protein